LLKEQELKLADVSARIEERASSRERMPVAEARVEDRRRALEKGRKLRDEAEKQKQGWEQKQIEFNTAKSALDEATYQLKLLIQKREQDERHFAESQTAAGGAQQAEAGYLAFLRAEERLRVLQQKQSERSAMRSQRDSAFQAKAEAELKVSAAKRQMTELTEERAGKSRQSETLRQQATDAAKKVADAKVECERSGQAVAVARHAWEELNRWLDSLPEKSEQIETLSQENLFAWDVRPALKARLEEARMAEELRKWDVKASQSEQARLSLAAQLTQIAGGVCPFLKEKCRQFDPKAVQKDISAFEKDVAAAVSRRQAASVELGRAKVHAAEARSRLLKQVQAKLDEARGHLDSRERERARAEQNLVNDQRNLEQAERALKELLSKGEQIDLATIRAGAELKAAAQRMAEWEDKLKQFASLEQELEQQQQAKEKHAKEHQVFLQNQPLAAKLGSFQAALTASRDAEARAAESVRWRAEKLEQAARDFDLEKLRRAQEAAAEAKSRFSSDERELETAQDELKKEKARLNQWKEACAERARIENEAGRQRAAMELSKAAAKILKNAAPAVAQHLCSRIAANAQRIFNQINQEPIELDWKAEPHYSLRIVPGHRRFAMLSGGEQTKLALAMTLAMIQEFSGLQFAVFDEPTYAVDSESRQKLADAILEAQKAAGLEQLLVVSHDDAFEGKIENVVMLRKTAAGTELVMAG
jgi:exonuclease SbcC